MEISCGEKQIKNSDTTKKPSRQTHKSGFARALSSAVTANWDKKNDMSTGAVNFCSAYVISHG
jgi:hypothetical protein